MCAASIPHRGRPLTVAVRGRARLLRGLPGWGAFAGAMVVTEGMSIHTQKAELRKEDNTLLRGVMLDVVPMCLCVLYVSWSIPFRIAFLQHFTFGARAAPKASARARAGRPSRERETPPVRAASTLRARGARAGREVPTAACASPRPRIADRKYALWWILDYAADIYFVIRWIVEDPNLFGYTLLVLPDHLRSRVEPSSRMGSTKELGSLERLMRHEGMCERIKERRTLKNFLYNLVATAPIEMLGSRSGMRRVLTASQTIVRAPPEPVSHSLPIGRCRCSRRIGSCGSQRRPGASVWSSPSSSTTRRWRWARCACGSSF